MRSMIDVCTCYNMGYTHAYGTACYMSILKTAEDNYKNADIDACFNESQWIKTSDLVKY